MVRHAKTKSSDDYTLLNCVSLKKKRLIKTCVFLGKYNHMEVCIDGRQVDELMNTKEGLRGLDNIIVLGGEESSACLVSIGPLSEDNTKLTPVTPTKRIALLSELFVGFYMPLMFSIFRARRQWIDGISK